jgi:type II secretory pathway predicted ATPase ExeA
MFLNLPSQNDFVLLVMWLLAALRPNGPYPLLAITGELGSAKTMISKMLRALIDPDAAPVSALRRKDRELSSQPIMATCWHFIMLRSAAVALRYVYRLASGDNRGHSAPPR